MDADRDSRLLEVHALLRDRAGLDPESLGARTVAHALQNRSWSNDSEFQDLLDELLVPETWFFRDVLPFRLLRDYAGRWRRQSPGGVFRALSVGCSTGEEAYSMAMVLCDAGLEPPRIQVLGVDLGRRALQAAAQATYGQRSFREDDAAMTALRDRFCERSGDRWSVRPELREAVRLRPANLAAMDFLREEPPFEVVFCRNVLIYFHADARRVALSNLDRLLAPGGILVCGHAEARILAGGRFRSCSAEYPLAFGHQGEQTAGEAETTPGERAPARAAGETAPGRTRPSRSPPAQTRPREEETPPAVAPPQDERALLQAARDAADSGRVGEAEALCRQVLAGNPSSVEGHYLLGVTRQAQGDEEEARRSYEKTLYLAPRHYEAIVHLMLLAERRGQRSAAENLRRRARLCAPGEAK